MLAPEWSRFGLAEVLPQYTPTRVKKHPPPCNILRARRLRGEMTDAERAMWRLLRELAPAARWRRQVPLRRFIVDFASHRTRLVIEVDGGQHSEEADAARTAAIEAEGYRVLRFWNNDVLGNAEGCASVLATALAARSPPSNSD
jgi:very-short-patch-repair endonuclease